jgi:predicted site-specific integrase-resolvase
MLSLREAAELAGTSKSSILRAVKTGRLSATRNEQGEFKVDAAEVARVYDKGSASHRGRRAPVDRSEAGDSTQRSDGANRIEALETENTALKDLIRRLDRDKEDLKTDRDLWRTQATQLAIAPPRRSWVWPWRR